MHTQPIHGNRRRFLRQAGARLRAQYARHHRSAAFWEACQQIQNELADGFPGHQAELCNRMAAFVQRLGAGSCRSCPTRSEGRPPHTGRSAIRIPRSRPMARPAPPPDPVTGPSHAAFA